MTTNEKVLWFIIALLFTIIVSMGFLAALSFTQSERDCLFSKYQQKHNVMKHKKRLHRPRLPRFTK